VPKEIECPDCKGRKETTICVGMKRYTYGCGFCQNKGVVKKCPACKGTGWDKKAKTYCPQCRFRFGLVPI
jgi:predicted Zn-dependent protease